MKMRKEQFSRAYVQAVAACAGFAWSIPSVDDDSVDMTLSLRGGNGIIRSPRLDPQLKCTDQEVSQNETIKYSIKLKNYDDLRDPNLLVPRILVVVFVPDDLKNWLYHSEEELAMRRCGYWASLRDSPKSDNAEGQTITIPRNQQLTVGAIQNIMQRIGQGEQP